MILGLDVQPTRLAVARLSMDGVVEFTACESITTDPPAQIRNLLRRSCRAPMQPVHESIESRFPGVQGMMELQYEPQVIRAESPYCPPQMGQRNLKMLGAVMARVEDACRSLWPWCPFEWLSPIKVWKGIGMPGRLPKRDEVKNRYSLFAGGLVWRDMSRFDTGIVQDECDAVCIAWGAVEDVA